MRSQISNKVIGIYSKKFKVHNAHSILVLFEDNRFNYSSGIGGCKSEIKGEWKITNRTQLTFRTDSIYTEEYLDRMVVKGINEAEKDFQTSQDTSQYEINIAIAKMKPCFPNLKKASFDRRWKSINFEKDIDCTCVSIKGEHRIKKLWRTR